MSVPDSSAASLLLVEGRDDSRVVRSVCDLAGLAHGFDIQSKDGIDNLLRSIVAHLQQPDVRVLGIVADANDDPNGRWQGIRGQLSRAGIVAPENLSVGGTVIEGEVRVGVWLMPDNRTPGELEDFVRHMIRADDPIWPRAESYIDDIPAADRRFASTKLTRAKLHAWLAAQERPRPMGLAIRAGVLDPAQPDVEAFVSWIERCFDIMPGGVQVGA